MATIIQDAIWPFRAGRPMTRDNGLIQMGIMGRKFSLMLLGKVEDAKNVFMTILPVSAAVITFWFAGRNNQQHSIPEIIKAVKEN